MPVILLAMLHQKFFPLAWQPKGRNGASAGLSVAETEPGRSQPAPSTRRHQGDSVTNGMLPHCVQCLPSPNHGMKPLSVARRTDLTLLLDQRVRTVTSGRRGTHQMERNSTSEGPALPAQGHQALFKLRTQPFWFVCPHGANAGELAYDWPRLCFRYGWGVLF